MQNIVTWPYVLRRGHSDDPSKGACALDAINWLVHSKHGDAPECACPVISVYVIRGNDEMPDATRQRLLGYLSRISGSRSAEHEMARARILTLAALRIFAPQALDAAGLHEDAAKLRTLPDDVNMEEAVAAARAAEAAAWEAAASEARAAEAVAAWDDYFLVLDAVLNAGPQGESWSVDVVQRQVALFDLAAAD